MHLTFESGLTAVMEVGTCNFANLSLWYVCGTDGTAVIDNWNCEGKMVRLNSWEDKDTVPSFGRRRPDQDHGPPGRQLHTSPRPERTLTTTSCI